MKQTMLLLLLAFLTACHAQRPGKSSLKPEPKPEKCNHVVCNPDSAAKSKNRRFICCVDQMPSYPEGGDSLRAFIRRNLRYPNTEACVQGRVICSFVVEEDGTCTNFKVVRSVDPALDKKALRVLRMMPKWNPGKRNGKPVRVNMVLPVAFRLEKPNCGMLSREYCKSSGLR